MQNLQEATITPTVHMSKSKSYIILNLCLWRIDTNWLETFCLQPQLYADGITKIKTSWKVKGRIFSTTRLTEKKKHKEKSHFYKVVYWKDKWILQSSCPGSPSPSVTAVTSLCPKRTSRYEWMDFIRNTFRGMKIPQKAAVRSCRVGSV